MDELGRLRDEVSALDRSVLEALNRRLEVVRRITEHKRGTGSPLIDAEREAELVAELKAANAGPLSDAGLQSVFAAVLDVMKQEVRRGARAEAAPPTAPAAAAIRSLAVVGTGLLGASVGLAAARAGVSRVAGWDADGTTLRGATAAKAVTAAPSLEEAVAEAELVVVAVPVGSLAATARSVLDAAAPGTTVTDVGSTKRALAALDASPSQRAEVLATLRSEPAAAALRQGPDRAGMMRFREKGVAGVLRALEDGRKVGFVVNAESLGTAVANGWFELPSDQRASLGGTNERGPGAIAAVSPGIFLRVLPKDPLAIEKRASKSRRVLALLGVGAVACSLALLAVLWARIRAARRTSELRVDFIAAISHELRTPASSLRMFGELLAGGHVAPEEQREVFEAVEREANRLGDTIERMLSLGRIAKGKLEPVRAETDVSALVGELIDAFEARTAGAFPVERDIAEGVTASVDAGLLRLAADNLLENARKYAPQGSPYRVTLGREGKRVSIRVEDHGPGIARRDQKRIFQPFERLDDKLSRSTEGSGLGLSLVRHVARAHGGDARVESELGKGATFVLTVQGGGR